MSLLQPSQVAIDNLQQLVTALTTTANSLRGIDRNGDGKISRGEIMVFAGPFLFSIFGQINKIDWNELEDEARDLQALEIAKILQIGIEQLEFIQPDQKKALYGLIDLLVYNLTKGPDVVANLNAAFGK